MLALNWKFLTPVSLVLLIVMSLLDKILEMGNVTGFWYIVVMLVANIVVGLSAINLARKYARQERRKVSQEKPIAAPSVTTDQIPAA